MSILKAVLFDLDGTLADTAPDIAHAANELRRFHGHSEIPSAEIANMIGNGSRTLVKRVLQYESFFVQEESALDQEHERFLAFYQNGFCAHSVVFDGVAHTLKSLQAAGLALGVVTNKPKRFIEPLLQHLGLRQYFAVLIGGDTLATKKPDAEPLLYACKQLHVQPQEALMVGDSVTDVLAARAAQLPIAAVTFGYNHGEDIRESQPDYVLEHFAELLTLPVVSAVLPA